MKNIIYKILILVITFSGTAKLKAEFPMNELLIYNYSGTFLFLKFYPISGLFNSKKFGNNDSTEYSIYSKLYIPNVPQSGAFRKGGGPPLKTIVGLDGYALNTLGYPGFYEFDNLTSCEFSVDF